METKKLNRDSKLLLTSQAFSFLGDYCVLPAILILATYYDNYWVVSGVLFVRSIPMVFQPFLGVLVDKYDRRKIMFWTDIGRGFAFLGILFIPFGELPLIFLALLLLAYGMGVFFNPARLSLMSCLGSDVKKLNVIFAKATTVCIVFGASAGAALLYFDQLKLAVLLNALSYLLSSFLVLFMKVKPPIVESAGLKNHVLEFRQGVHTIIHNIQVRNAVLLMILMATFCGIFYSYYPIVSQNFFDGEIGNFILTIALGIGGFVGAQLVSAANNHNHSILIFTVLTLFSMIFFITTPSFLIGVGFAVIFYMAMEFGEVIAKTSVHQNTESVLQGRVFSISEALIGISLAIGSTLINLLNLWSIMIVVVVMLIGFYIHDYYANHVNTHMEQDLKKLKEEV